MTTPALQTLLLLALVLTSITSASAQIMESREAGGKTITCMHTGLTSDLKDCGVWDSWYTYVFVGYIATVVPADKDEKKIQIAPEEIFHGNPPASLTVITSQVDCLPPLNMGDLWLFFLRKVGGKPIVLDYYGNISRPAADAQDEIETLRRLKTIGDFGIVRGTVKRGNFFEGEAVPGARVVASRESDSAQFFATTDENGDFEFEPLGPGKYGLAAGTAGSFRADSTSIDVNPGSCWHITMSKSPHARIAGHVRHPDGTPVAGVPVIVIDEDGSGYETEKSDKNGYFYSDGMRQGKYVVGINLPGSPAWKYGGCGGSCEIPPASLYYPGVHGRSDALTITLAEDEKRENIDFVVPNQ